MTITIVKTLKERLTFARELRGLTQAQLAKACRCSQGAIGNVESGERLTLRNLVVVARVLRISADWLHDGHGPTPTKDEFFQPIHQITRYPSNNLTISAVSMESGSNQSALTTASYDSQTGSSASTNFDNWTSEAISIMMSLPDNDKRAAVANLRTFVHNLSPPTEQVVPANNERNGTYS